MRSLALVLLLATGCLAETVLLWPPKRAATYPQLREMIANNKVEVFRAWATANQQPEAYVLAFFGNGMLADEPTAQLAAALDGLPIEVWGVNYPGYGQSAGPTSLDGVARVAREAYRELAKRAGGKPILLFGYSLGTTAALHVAANEQVTASVLVSPVPLPELILRRHGWWNLFLLAVPVALDIPDALDAVENARRARAPAVFVGASEDAVVPLAYQERVMKAYAGDWRFIEIRGADHNTPMPDWVRSELKRTVAEAIATNHERDWFSDTLDVASRRR